MRGAEREDKEERGRRGVRRGIGKSREYIAGRKKHKIYIKHMNNVSDKDIEGKKDRKVQGSSPPFTLPSGLQRESMKEK